MDRFPMHETAQYSYKQSFSVQHRGIDIMAPLGTILVAVEGGSAWSSVETKGGNVVYLDGKSGTRYFYGHLDRWSSRLSLGTPKVAVNAGDDLGFVGTTGNASGGPPHCHLQVRIGSLLVDPFEELQAVDPHPERGSPGSTVDFDRQKRSWVLPSGVLLLALIWLATKGSR